jgi:hypothetical protein
MNTNDLPDKQISLGRLAVHVLRIEAMLEASINLQVEILARLDQASDEQVKELKTKISDDWKGQLLSAYHSLPDLE